MPRRPKARDGLTAGERVARYEAEQLEKQKRMRDASNEERRSEDSARVSDAPEGVVESKKTVKAEKKVLPKPQSATVRVDFSVPVGSVKPMHGMCNGPVSYGADISEVFRNIGVPFVRFDATDTAISSYAVDISRIFKRQDADPADPSSYDFSVTDRYFEAARLCGAEIILRLGESVDLFGGKGNAGVPDDETLSRVCVNIIRHYNDRWAGGYSLGISRVELWNLGGDRSAEENFEIYRRLSVAVKLYDDTIKVGGMSFEGFGDRAKEFLRFCKRTRTPLDFVTVDCMCGSPESVANEARAYSLQLKRAGFADSEIIIGKWCYVDSEAASEKKIEEILCGNGEALLQIKRQMFEAQRGIRGAAYAAAFMVALGEVDGVSLGCFFDAQPMISPFCAITDRFGNPEKPFYAFKAFGEMYKAGTAALCSIDESEGFAHPGIYAMAARSANGECFVMISSFEGVGTVDLRLDGISDELYTADVYMLDGVKNMELCDTVQLSGMKKRMVINLSKYGVMMIRLY